MHNLADVNPDPFSPSPSSGLFSHAHASPAVETSNALYCTSCDYVISFAGESDEIVLELTCTQCGSGNMEVLTEPSDDAYYGGDTSDASPALRHSPSQDRLSTSSKRPYHHAKSQSQSLSQTVRKDSGGARKSLESSNSVGEKVMKNFRELLWYWQEYYLRRGRDRLSIEFSSHIPFKHWNSLVELLCKDDGAPTSLLSCPIKLPTSPYKRPFIRTNITRSAENCIINMN